MKRIVVMAKRPRLGRVKTRLAATIGEAAALALYRAFLDDVLAGVASLADDRLEFELCYDGPPDVGDPAPEPFHVTRQVEGDLGARLRAALDRALGEGARSVLFLGADAPTFSPSRVSEGLRALDVEDLVLASADDGGYVMIGLGGPHHEVLSEMPWSRPTLFEATREAARSAGLRCRIVEGGYDVDDAPSLARLRDELARDPRAAPASRAALAQLDGAGEPVV